MLKSLPTLHVVSFDLHVVYRILVPCHIFNISSSTYSAWVIDNSSCCEFTRDTFSLLVSVPPSTGDFDNHRLSKHTHPSSDNMFSSISSVPTSLQVRKPPPFNFSTETPLVGYHDLVLLYIYSQKLSFCLHEHISLKIWFRDGVILSVSHTILHFPLFARQTIHPRFSLARLDVVSHVLCRFSF